MEIQVEIQSVQGGGEQERERREEEIVKKLKIKPYTRHNVTMEIW